MSRIGKLPINIPTGVTVTLNDGIVAVKGPKGELSQKVDTSINVKVEDAQVVLDINEESAVNYKQKQAFHGLYRSLVNNMVVGVSEGFKIKLELVGVGYRVAANGKGLTLALGYSHPVEIAPIDGINFVVEGNTKITVEGIDKQLVGQVASDIRAKRAPEPYKGKGVKYADEKIRRKEGKKG